MQRESKRRGRRRRAGGAAAGFVLAVGLAGCDPQPTLKITLYDVPEQVDRFDTTVWLRYPDPANSKARLIEELVRPGLGDQTILPRSSPVNSGRVSLGLALSGNTHPSADTSVIITVLARQGTRLLARGVGEALLVEAQPKIPDILDIRLADPLRPQDEALRSLRMGYSSAQSTCDLTGNDPLPELTIEGWGFTPTIHARFEEVLPMGADGGQVIERDYFAESAARVRIKFDPQLESLPATSQVKLTLSTRSSGTAGTDFYTSPEVLPTCPKGPPRQM
ncbi:MAG: hypothetical protein U1A78_23205 [Polyangia bacterium]